MKGDFSRPYAQPDDNYSGVLYQQGRVFIDADGNAQTRIALGWQDAAGRDLLGATVAAVPSEEPDAFKIDSATVSGDHVHLTLEPGRLWAGGIPVRLDETAPVGRDATYLSPPAAHTGSIADGVRDAVILEVWREALSGFQLDDPTQLVEPALGGPDTTERLMTGFDIRLLRLEDGDTCTNIAGKLADDPSTKGHLTVSLQPTTVVPGDCPVEDSGGYTGFEHNTFRIEIAEVDASGAWLKWSRNNGGLVGRGLFDAATKLVTITANLQPIITAGRDSFYLETRVYDVATGRWRLTYGATVTLNASNQLVLPMTPSFGAIPAPGTPVFFRLWDELRNTADFPDTGTPVELVDGICLQFQPDAPGRYRPGDYWCFEVRAGGLANPQTLIDDEPPEGILYTRVPFGILLWDGSPDLAAAEGTIEDCRRRFPPLTELGCCCTYRVGDGLVSHGDFDSIQEAVDHLPAEGGEICVLPGTHYGPVLLKGRHDVTISGCGWRSRIVGTVAEDGTADPAIHVAGGQYIRIRDLAIQAAEGGLGILLDGGSGAVIGGAVALDAVEMVARLPVRAVLMTNLMVVANSESAVRVIDGQLIALRDCFLYMEQRAGGAPALFFQGQDGWIERNVVRVSPSRETAAGNVLFSEGEPYTVGAGLGGIQIGGRSARIHIDHNLIQGGVGNGITLGSILTIDANGNEIGITPGWVINVKDPCFPCKPGDTRVPDPGGQDGGTREVSAGPLREIQICKNRILDMGLNGIGVVGFFNISKADEFISVDELTITGNAIRRCLWRSIAPIEKAMLDAMGYGAISLADVSGLVIRDNRLDDNGPDHLDPVCGIFVLHGEGIEISRNHIRNNGAKTGEPDSNARPGRRGGIQIVYCLAPTIPTTILRVLVPVQNGTPAVVVQENVVSAPLGRALSIAALGPVIVHGNSFTTRGVITGAEFLDASFIAATVAILDLGLSNEIYWQLGAFAEVRKGQLSVQNKMAITTDEVILQPRTGLDDLLFGARLANGNVLFNDNQVVLDLLETGLDLSVSSILIATLDDLSFQDNQCDCGLLDDYVLSHAILLGISLRVTGNRFKEGIRNALLSAVTLGMMNNTSNNQSTHCLMIRPSAPYIYTVAEPNTVLLGAMSDGFCKPFGSVIASEGKLTTGNLAGEEG